MVIHTLCPLCSSGNISMHLRCADHLIDKEEFDLYKCADCGFVFTMRYPDEGAMDRYYGSADYISHDDQAKGFLNKVYLIIRSLMLNRKKKIIEKAAGIKKGRLLDIGCGSGYFAGNMKKYGWDVTGIEPNTKAREYAKRKYAVDVINPQQLSSLHSGSFDIITLWHVLEHFHDPFMYASEIRRLLKPGGICLVALPNCGSYDAEYYRETWAAYDVPRHLWHFAPATFRDFAVKTGFKITGIKPLPFDVFYISILSEKNRTAGFSFLRGLIRGIIFSVQALFDKNKSSSLIYLLQVNETVT